MKNLIPLAFSLLLFSSCGNHEVTTHKTSAVQDSIPVTPDYEFDESRLEGQYMGSFNKSTIIVKINYVKGKNASGYNIVRGNKRNIKGTVTNKGNHFHFDLDEPGDDQYDGTFHFDIDTANFHLTGNWEPIHPDKTGAKDLSLERIEKEDSDGNSNLITWYGDISEQYGSLNLRNDGTCYFKGTIYHDADGSYEEFNVKGTWIETNDDITVEFEKTKYVTPYKIVLQKISEDYDGSYSEHFLKQENVANFYEYF